MRIQQARHKVLYVVTEGRTGKTVGRVLHCSFFFLSETGF